jgi:hypothetical protein
MRWRQASLSALEIAMKRKLAELEVDTSPSHLDPESMWLVIASGWLSRVAAQVQEVAAMLPDKARKRGRIT